MRDAFYRDVVKRDGHRFDSPEVAEWYIFWMSLGARPSVAPVTHEMLFPGIERYDVPHTNHAIYFTPHFELKQGYVYHTNGRPTEQTLLAARDLATIEDKVVHIIEDRLRVPQRDRSSNTVTFCRPDSVPVRGGRILMTRGKLNFGYPLVFGELYDAKIVDACIYAEQFQLGRHRVEN